MRVLTAVRRAREVGWEAKPARYSTPPLRPIRGPLTMANIKSQIKRNNRSQRERIENRRYTSAIKTYFRRLETAVNAGDDEAAGAEHLKLISLIDKAVKRGALHANTGGRKKSRAERLRRSVTAAAK
jgi:small subunit ribosomal protein S20